MKSETTKKAKNKMIVLGIISFLINVIPLCFFIGYAFYTGSPTEKIALSLTAIVGLFFAVLNILLKWHIRCGLWIIIFGLCYALKENADVILALTGTMAASVAVDEFVITPLAKRYKEKYHINKEIDKRI